MAGGLSNVIGYRNSIAMFALRFPHLLRNRFSRLRSEGEHNVPAFSELLYEPEGRDAVGIGCRADGGDGRPAAPRACLHDPARSELGQLRLDLPAGSIIYDGDELTVGCTQRFAADGRQVGLRPWFRSSPEQTADGFTSSYDFSDTRAELVDRYTPTLTPAPTPTLTRAPLPTATGLTGASGYLRWRAG